MKSILLEVELHLRLTDDPRHVGTVLIPAPEHRHSPRRATYPPIYPPHAAEVNVGFQTGQTRQRLDALDQQLAELHGSACGLSHRFIIDIGGQSHGVA